MALEEDHLGSFLITGVPWSPSEAVVCGTYERSQINGNFENNVN